MTQIIIRDNRCFIKEASDQGVLWELDRELSFKVQGAEHTRAFKGYVDRDGNFTRWDGRQKLLEESNLSFAIGLLQRVEDFFKTRNIDYNIIDERPSKSPGSQIDILPTLNSLGKPPYFYQIDAMKAARQRDHGIIRLATGGGKSLISALITADIGKETIIYVIGKDLLYQFYNLYQSLFPDIKIGIIGDGFCEIGDINIASVWTVGQAIGLNKTKILTDSVDEEKQVESNKYQDIRNLMLRAKVHIIDECHVSACNTIQEISKYINPEHIYGMSATPQRDDGSDLLVESILGKYLINISASYLIEHGFLVKPVIKFVRVPKYNTQLPKNYKTIYQKYIVENEIRNNLIIKGASRLVEQNYQTLVLYNTVNHGKILYKELSKQLPCILLSGKDDSKVRDKAKEDLESGKIKCIIASKIFDIGVDLPSLSGLVVAGSGKSSVRALQRIGRVIRKFPNKKQAAVIDFIDDAHYVKNHSRSRKIIYNSEEQFEVIWPELK